MDEEMIKINMEIIAHAGMAKTYYLNALDAARNGDFNEADQAYQQAREEYLIAHRTHADILQRFASGETIKSDILLIHAENHLSSAEILGHLAEEIIELRKERNNG